MGVRGVNVRVLVRKLELLGANSERFDNKPVIV